MSASKKLADLVREEINTLYDALTDRMLIMGDEAVERQQLGDAPGVTLRMAERERLDNLRQRLTDLVEAQDWTAEQCAEAWGVQVKTWHGYVARGAAPKPSTHSGRTPIWDADTVTSWKRPGQGARTDRNATEDNRGGTR
ncbi:hypothetical protein [Streptomyces syringium]|uniref:hypothetical protein n=1 Tax=Streptomyces syringium TaxID=76729 RepID=UPI0033EB12BA